MEKALLILIFLSVVLGVLRVTSVTEKIVSKLVLNDTTLECKRELEYTRRELERVKSQLKIEMESNELLKKDYDEKLYAARDKYLKDIDTICNKMLKNEETKI